MLKRENGLHFLPGNIKSCTCLSADGRKGQNHNQHYAKVLLEYST